MDPNSDPWPFLAFQSGIEIFVRANRQEHQLAWLVFGVQLFGNAGVYVSVQTLGKTSRVP
jgi:hypothetical protein